MITTEQRREILAALILSHYAILNPPPLNATHAGITKAIQDREQAALSQYGADKQFYLIVTTCFQTITEALETP